MRFAIVFIRHMLDRQAHVGTATVTASDLPTASLLIINTTIALVDSILHLTKHAVTYTALLAPLVVLMVASAMAGHVVTKTVTKAGAILPAAERLEYRYPQFIRFIAKMVLVGSLAYLPLTVYRVIEARKPIPPVFGGYLIDAATNQPIDGAWVRIVTPTGEEIAATSPSDTEGFYTVEADRTFDRRSTLQVASRSCGSSAVLSLARSREVSRTNLHSPIFKHFLQCMEQQ